MQAASRNDVEIDRKAANLQLMNISVLSDEVQEDNKLFESVSSFLLNETYNDLIFGAISNQDYNTFASELIKNDLRVLIARNSYGKNVFSRIIGDGWYKGFKLVLSTLSQRMNVLSCIDNENVSEDMKKNKESLKVSNGGSNNVKTGRKIVYKDSVLYFKYQWSIDTRNCA